jgi:hypothetical protein
MTDNQTSAAPVADAETTAIPDGLQTTAADLAWSVDDNAPDVMPTDGARPLSKALLALLAAVVASAVALGAFMLGLREPDRVSAPAAAPAVATPHSSQFAAAAKPAPTTAPPPKPKPRVRIEASPPVETEVPPPPPPPPPPQFDPARDQWLLNNLRSLGYVIINPPLVISNAHEACRLFREGESSEQVNQEMSARMGANMIDTLQLTSSAMLAYPNCY